MQESGEKHRMFLADLEVHLRRGVRIPEAMEMFRRSGDLFCITGRGANRKGFEYTFGEFVAAVKGEADYMVASDSQFAIVVSDEGSHTFFLKAQEILCEEGVDLLLVGCHQDFDDGESAFALIKSCKAEGGISILGHPFKEPNNLRTVVWGSPRVELLELIAQKTDCVATFNQQMVPFFARANRRAEEFASALNLSGVSVSDSHLYRDVSPRRLAGTGIVFRKAEFRWNHGYRVAVESLREILLEGRFRRISAGHCAVFDLMRLSWRDLRLLYNQ